MPTPPKGKKQKLSADTILDSDNDDDEKGAHSPSEDETNSDGPQKNADGEIYFDLTKTRRVTLRKWKGKNLVDIREFWGDQGDLKPGKKGISLTVEQWKRLLEIVPEISKRIGSE